ncbi:hypothetical protein [Clostridium sp.]|uniref:hypothetical protein n=1 Tax=Clostridium sp. TaxID=1506 RepID=UPI003D6D3F26
MNNKNIIFSIFLLLILFIILNNINFIDLTLKGAVSYFIAVLFFSILLLFIKLYYEKFFLVNKTFSTFVGLVLIIFMFTASLSIYWSTNNISKYSLNISKKSRLYIVCKKQSALPSDLYFYNIYDKNLENKLIGVYTIKGKLDKLIIDKKHIKQLKEDGNLVISIDNTICLVKNSESNFFKLRK